MTAVLVSDAHLHGADDPAQADLVAFIDGLEVDELVLVGDIVQFWFSTQTLVFADYVPLLAALHRFRGRVTWLQGNHELKCAGALSRLGIDFASHWRGHTEDGRRVLALHGDAGDPSWKHGLWRRVQRSDALSRWVAWAGPDRAHRWVSRWTERSRRNRNGVSATLVHEQLRWAEGLLREADVVCVGHTHAPGRSERDGGTLVNLGDWEAHRTYAVVDREVSLYRWRSTGAREVRGPPAPRDGKVASP